MENIELKLYTIAELRDWLIHNRPAAGLSEALISKQRAYAMIMNPHANDDMPVISALFINDEVAAYTACFHEVMAKPKDMSIQWWTTLYVNPKYEGRGYAYIVLQQMVEIYGNSFYDLDAAEASQANIQYIGLAIDYINRYIVGKIAIKPPFKMPRVLRNLYVRRLARQLKKNALAQLRMKPYTTEYTTFMDDATYAFLQQHSKSDLFLRKQEVFTWMLQHGFRQEGPSEQKNEINKEFPGSKPVYRIYGVRVICDGKLVGFYMLRHSSDDLAVKYVYYEQDYQDSVFASISEHLLLTDNSHFITHHEPLAKYISSMTDLFEKAHIEKISFAYPKSFNYHKEYQIQGGDGDMFV